MKTVWILLISAFLAGALALANFGPATARADEGSTAVKADDHDQKAKEKPIVGSDSKGKYFYKKHCKTCHGPKAEAGELTPLSKTIKQWERFFDKGVHYKVKDEDGKKVKVPLLDVKDITPEKLIHISTFLINHAADSDQPETCG